MAGREHPGDTAGGTGVEAIEWRSHVSILLQIILSDATTVLQEIGRCDGGLLAVALLQPLWDGCPVDLFVVVRFDFSHTYRFMTFERGLKVAIYTS